MDFHSIVFDRPGSSVNVDGEREPSFFGDLNLDQVLTSMTARREKYGLEPFFYVPLRDVAAVLYRHEVLRDLEQRAVFEAVDAFVLTMRGLPDFAQLDKLYRYQRAGLFVGAVEVYCDAVHSLAEELARLEVTSRGLQAFRGYLVDYIGSDRFTTLAAETQRLKEALAGVRYAVRISGARVRVSKYQGEADYSAEVEETFSKFKQGAVKDYRVEFRDAGMTHVEAQIVELVARLYPDVFLPLDEYYVRHRDYLDPTIGAFVREVPFYLAYLEYIEPFKSAGLPFCYPHVSARANEIRIDEAFDVALANKLVPERSPVVRNGFALKAPERILVVTGPNQGGKTTFARMFGQLHYLASLGLPVPGLRARLRCPTGSSRISRRKKTSRRYGASSRTSWSESARSCGRRRAAASSS